MRKVINPSSCFEKVNKAVVFLFVVSDIRALEKFVMSNNLMNDSNLQDFVICDEDNLAQTTRAYLLIKALVYCIKYRSLVLLVKGFH